ncbi:hypothetical protein FPV67DRAFT_1472030 [Lyophyllum atratum]|nr:hypothetical protein FPV67DRAFT_1472030 [Lyophyllum atratum]
MPRPGPLQELPLEQFLPSNPNLPTTSRKRPLSPGGPNLFSPAKRRILNEEAIFETPLSRRGTPARFTEVLTGPGSPAKKLDFGSPKRLLESSAASRRLAFGTTPPHSRASSSRLAPSPELRPPVSSFSTQPSDDQEMDDYFSQPSSSSSMLPPSSYSSDIPDEIPRPSDPQSIHYPGFCVYFDMRLSVSPVEETGQSVTPVGGDKEDVKENIAPRKKPRKAVTIPDTGLKSQLLSPHTKKREIERLKSKSTPPTPKKVLFGDRAEPFASPAPRRP